MSTQRSTASYTVIESEKLNYLCNEVTRLMNEGFLLHGYMLVTPPVFNTDGSVAQGRNYIQALFRRSGVKVTPQYPN